MADHLWRDTNCVQKMAITDITVYRRSLYYIDKFLATILFCPFNFWFSNCKVYGPPFDIWCQVQTSDNHLIKDHLTLGHILVIWILIQSGFWMMTVQSTSKYQTNLSGFWMVHLARPFIHKKYLFYVQKPSSLAENSIFGPVFEWLKQDCRLFENCTQICPEIKWFCYLDVQFSDVHSVLFLVHSTLIIPNASYI
jgi:hypothetical protein